MRPNADAPCAPKALADPAEVARRRDLARSAPHLALLQPCLDAVRARHGAVPDPDPLDGGAGARLLLLLETPGPSIGASGFVSRDNPTGTAANLFRFLLAAGLDRRETLIWNAVPFVIHAPGARNRAPNRAEIAAGLSELPPFLAMLPRLEAAVLAGRVARLAAPVLAAARPELAVFAMPHPSPTLVCTGPAVSAAIAACLEAASRHLRAPARAA